MAASRKPTSEDGADPGGLLLRSLAELPVPAEAGDQPGRVVLAVSGGSDSTALMLVAAACLPASRLVVGHIHHGMQAAADDWLAQVRRQAESLGLRFRSRHLDCLAAASRRHDGLGPEGWARRERYRALADIAHEVGAAAIIVAHHRDDQIETHLLQAARGAGDRGLSAMAPSRWLESAPGAPLRLLRPFLSLPRSRLRAIVRQAAWSAVEDPSNDDPARERSRLRLARAAEREAGAQARREQAEADRALLRAIDRHRADDARAREQASRDLEQVVGGRGSPSAYAPGRSESEFTRADLLSRPLLAGLPEARRAALWRYWLEAAGCALPSRRRLLEIDRQMVLATGPEARLRHDGRWLLRYRDRIGLMRTLPTALLPRRIQSRDLCSSDLDADWLIALPAWLPAEIEIGPGRANDRWRAASALTGPAPGQTAGSHALRKLWQEGGIPPWLRLALPVLRDPDSGRVLAAAPFGRIVQAGSGALDGRPVRTAPPGTGSGQDLRQDAGQSAGLHHDQHGWRWRPPTAWRPWMGAAGRTVSGSI